MQNDENAGMTAGFDAAPIIIRKKVAHHGRHGGSWKVAYADFVTAMMALFMVMWLVNASKDAKEAVAAYFQDPRGFEGQYGSAKSGSGEGLSVTKEDLEDLAQRIQQSMQQMAQFESLRDNVAMTVTGDGLRIELLENDTDTFFQSGSPAPTGPGKNLILKIGEELDKLPNRLVLEGHTDSHPYRGRPDYSNWELSVDRANAARRILVESGVAAERIAEVRGFADMQLRTPNQPEDPSNRRISLLVKYDDPWVPSGGSNEAAVQ